MDERRADAIVVLGCNIKEPHGERLNPCLLARADGAARLYKNGLAPVIVACGGHDRRTGLVEADVIAERLIASGVPASAVRRERESTSTWQNLRFAKPLLPGKEILLVSEGYHLPRALWVARANGLIAHPVPVHSECYDSLFTRASIREAFALVWYQVRFFLWR